METDAQSSVGARKQPKMLVATVVLAIVGLALFPTTLSKGYQPWNSLAAGSFALALVALCPVAWRRDSGDPDWRRWMIPFVGLLGIGAVFFALGLVAWATQ
jgi:hypothetical protein